MRPQFQFFLFDQFKVVRIIFFLCQYGLWSVDSCGWGMNIVAMLFVVYYMLLSLCSVVYIIFILLGSFF